MDILKLDFTGSSLDNVYINISNSEIIQLHKKILYSYYHYLQAYGVKPLWNGDGSDVDLDSISAREYQLIFLCKHIHCLVHKDLVSAFVRSKIPSAGLDQQVRHLASQFGWYILNKSEKIPDIDVTVPSGYHYLVSLESPNPKIIATTIKRKGRLAAKTFDELKLVYDNKCATCGIDEGKKDYRNGNVVVKLQQGHMNPSQALTLANTIPQCQYCNQTYKDYFIFNEYGRVIAVNNPLILLQSPVDVKNKMIEVLLREREKKSELSLF